MADAPRARGTHPCAQQAEPSRQVNITLPIASLLLPLDSYIHYYNTQIALPQGIPELNRQIVVREALQEHLNHLRTSSPDLFPQPSSVPEKGDHP